MPAWIKNNGLLIANLLLFVVFLGGMTVAGWQVYNDDQLDHGSPPVGITEYLGTGDYGEAVFENWESELLQMGMYVVLTAYLFQKGSSESKPIGSPAPQDADPRLARKTSTTPWPVRRGGWVLAVYEHSLAIFFFVLFFATVALHAATGAAANSEEQAAHGQPAVTAVEYLGTSQFWFESLQNWQSEFLAVALIVGASVWLRYRGSAESKPVAAPHAETGE
jgi:hypothetical protein